MDALQARGVLMTILRRELIAGGYGDLVLTLDASIDPWIQCFSTGRVDLVVGRMIRVMQ